MKVLIIEDEVDLLITIGNYLAKENYICELADSYQKATHKLSAYQYDMILLDISLPDGNGIELLGTIRKFQLKSGVIIISAKNSLDDKIHGLDLGADDYLTKPFQLSELNSRIKAVLRRHHFDGTPMVTFKEISIDTNSRTVQVNGNEVILTPKEYDLLLFFLINRNRVLTKEAIVEHLWSDHIEMADTLDFIYTHLNNLRKKIKQAGGTDHIRTIYGTGYMFTEG
jgi:DNA-binding response OmpR family regulator